MDRLGCMKMRPCEEGTDALLRRAMAAPTSEERNTLLRQADSAITSAHYFIPIAQPLRWSLVRPAIQGWKPSPIAQHPWHRLALSAR
jgi:peptide/nickel transport system substrate-binding protein/oligopeptide transport system substrate-binding protein